MYLNEDKNETWLGDEGMPKTLLPKIQSFIPTFVFMLQLSVVFSLSVSSSPASFVQSGNPWGVVFEEISASGFALERVELLTNQMWEITARLSVTESSAYVEQATSTERTPVIFLGPPELEIPSANINTRGFLASSALISKFLRPWLIENRVSQVPFFDESFPNHFIRGPFSYVDIPTNSPTRNFATPSETTSVDIVEKHPSIDGCSLVRITIPHSAVTILAPVDNDSGTRDILVGVALLSPSHPTRDHIYSGKVRLLDFRSTPLVRSFTALTSTRYTFLTHTSMQILETQIDSVWSYVAVITFGLETGVSSPQIDTTKAFFAVSPSVAKSDASNWKPMRCPSETPASLSGCATDIFPTNASFCVTETILTGDDDTRPVYRIRVQLGTYESQPETSDSVFIRMLVEGADDAGSKVFSFMNVRTRLLSSSIRCGAVIVREPSLTDPLDGDSVLFTDPVVMQVYSGTTLVPMTHDTTGAPLITSAESSPTTLSSVSNLHARSILDSLVTIALIGYDKAFPMSRRVFMVDLISIHVRDESLHGVLNSLVRTGSAYSVDFTTKRLTTSPTFDSLCDEDSDICQRRFLMRNGELLEPNHAHTDMSMVEDTEWLNELFGDVTTSTSIADAFVKNVYKTLEPNNLYRRIVWVDSTYAWPVSKQDSSKDYMLLLASFNTA